MTIPEQYPRKHPKFVSITMSCAMEKMARVKAAQEGISRSELMRRAIAEFLVKAGIREAQLED